MTFSYRSQLVALLVSLAPALAVAQPSVLAETTREVSSPEPDPAPVVGAWEDYPRDTAFEVNVLWPVFPGGMVDLKIVIPTLFPHQGNWRGETILGLNADFGWRVIRDSDAGNVAILSAVVGWRQFFGYGLHVDVVAHLGWRHQERNPWDGEPIHSFQGRFWAWAGYQHEFTRDVYANLRGGIGVHMFRTDRFADQERPVAFGGDLNLGFRIH